MNAGAAPPRADARDDALGELRSLLFGLESRRIESLEAELRALAASRLERADLKSATAAILADALREAEVARHRELADALAPLVVAAIRAEIRNSREAMVEALYPLMGRLVAAAVTDSFRRLSDDLADRIDALISARRWRWRFKSWATGRPIGEIALAEAQRARVTRVLALERGSGSLIAVWPQAEADGRSDMLSGLIAAITEFAAETFVREGGALRALDLGARRVLLRSSATLIVAAECEGVLQAADEQAIDDAFLGLLRRHERVRQLSASDLSSLDAALTTPPQRRPGVAAIWSVRVVGLAALAALGVWLAGTALDWLRARRIESRFAAARAAEPASLAYPLRIEIDAAARRATLRGLAPSRTEADRLVEALKPAAQPYAMTSDVQIVASDRAVGDARTDLEARSLAWRESARALEQESRQIVEQARQREAAAAAALESRASAFDAELAAANRRAEASQAEIERTRRDLERATAGLNAARTAQTEADARVAALASELAALRAREDAPDQRLRRLVAASAVFFTRNAEFADVKQAGEVADRLAALLKETGARLRIIGHTDDSGSPSANLQRSRSRADAMARLVTERGVPTQVLIIASRRDMHSVTDVSYPSTIANRRVTFELPFEGEPGP